MPYVGQFLSYYTRGDWRDAYPLVTTFLQVRNMRHGSPVFRLFTSYMLADIDRLEEEWQTGSLSGLSEDGSWLLERLGLCNGQMIGQAMCCAVWGLQIVLLSRIWGEWRKRW